jgi:Ca2+/H+ antiporter
MMDTVKDFVGTVGTTSAGYARRLGCSTSALARRVGPRRGAIALGVLAAAIGVPLLVRYLRARKATVDEREPESVTPMNLSPIPATAPIGPALA